MNEIEKKEYIEKLIPYKEQSIMMFAFTAFIELLKYQKEHITNPIVWECYILGLKDLFEVYIKELLECQK